MTSGEQHCKPAKPSDWVTRHAAEVRPGTRVLDLACGNGRNGRLFLGLGHHVTFLDIDTSGVTDLTGEARADILAADLEGKVWPLGQRAFGAILVVNYLWRPLMRHILASLEPGGVLIYETFMLGQENLGRPRNPDFLLRPDELRDQLPPGFRTLAFEQGLFHEPQPVMRQRICAVRSA